MPREKRIDRIAISETEIAEYDGHKKVVVIPIDDIKETVIEYGFSEERPITSIIIGFICLAPGVSLGLLPIYSYFSRFLKGERIGGGNVGLFAFAVPLIFIGVYFIFKVFRRSYFLKIVTNTSNRKLPFNRNTEKTNIDIFSKECSRILGQKFKQKEQNGVKP